MFTTPRAQVFPVLPLRDIVVFPHMIVPLFVGRDAETGAEEIMADFDQWPDVKARVKSFIRVAGRRWDIRLDNGVIVKLPEHDMAKAMAVLLARLRDREQQERHAKEAHLRKSLVGSGDRRQLAVEARAKAIKKEGEEI